MTPEIESNYRRRITDRFLVIPTWQRISEAEYHPPPGDSPTGSSEEHAYSKVLAEIVEKGCWLQRAVAEGWDVAASLEHELAVYADLDNRIYEESPRERLAACYLLWPYHSARYYGYRTATEPERLSSREALCKIQTILYNNVRGTLDVLRLWFNEFSDKDVKSYVVEREWREKWRPKKLLDFVPDLCAVDYLAEHILEVIKGRALVRRAIESIQALSLRPNTKPDANTADEHSDVCSAVVKAFETLRVAQMTVFYNPNPVDVKDQDEIPLYELVHEMSDSDSVPAKLIPFGGGEQTAKNFRKLASTIYSIKDPKSFPSFFAQRQQTIGRLGEPTSFISDGAITSYFLSSKPPLYDNSNSNGHGPMPGQNHWPLWYKHTLSDFNFDGDPPDWTDPFWWNPIDCQRLKQELFPGPCIDQLNLHHNSHGSAYWDAMVVEKKEFIQKVDIPPTYPTGEASFNYLMELLLRREDETRTSFFFALAQTFEKNSRLCQFVGGTFLGLERPGIPFSHGRFEALAARVRGLIMAVAHYTTTQATKRSRWQAEQERSDFEKRVDLIVSLLRGLDKTKYPRGGHLLFASPVPGNPNRTDHDYRPNERIGWRPSRAQLKSVFTTAHFSELPQSFKFSPQTCNDTWKALLYLGGTADNNTLKEFLVNKDNEGDDLIKADRAVTCHKCFRAALEFLLSPDMYAELEEKIQISDSSLLLPSRPGIRFLIALCRFLVDVQAQASSENTAVVGIEFKTNSVIIDFDKPKLIERLWDRRGFGKPNVIHTAGIFRMLENNWPLESKKAKDSWTRFLIDPKFATKIDAEPSENKLQLTLRW